MLLFIWLLNFGISWLNAWGCGKSWTETKHLGGGAHFMNWMGAVMSACGFTWCYVLVLSFAGGSFTHEVDGHAVPYLSQRAVEAVCGLGYMAVILPVLGSGLAITVHAVVTAWRRRTVADTAVAAWDVFAQVYNTYNAIEDVPGVFDGLSGFFGGDDEDSGVKALVVAAVVFCVLGGVLTTYTILTSTSRSTSIARAFAYRSRAA